MYTIISAGVACFFIPFDYKIIIYKLYNCEWLICAYIPLKSKNGQRTLQGLTGKKPIKEVSLSPSVLRMICDCIQTAAMDKSFSKWRTKFKYAVNAK